MQKAMIYPLLLLLFICPVARAAPAPVSYTVIDLGTLGGKNCTAFALNNHSQIVGGSQTASGHTHAFLWNQGKMRDLGTLPGDKSSAAHALNEAGEVVGVSDQVDVRGELGGGFTGMSDYGKQAVVWNSGVIKKLPTGRGSMASSVDDAGSITGISTQGDVPDGFVLAGGKMIEVGGPYTQAAAIAGGKAVGTFFTARDKNKISYEHAFIWSAGHLRDLGIEEVTGVGGLNDAGQVVGMATRFPGSRSTDRHLEAFVWQTGKIRFLGRLSGSQGNSLAWGINRSGAVVGWSHGKEGYAEAVLWQNGQMVNLNACASVPHGWTLDAAQAINDHGQILCRGYTVTGKLKSGSYALPLGAEFLGMVRHSFLLTPVTKAALPPSVAPSTR